MLKATIYNKAITGINIHNSDERENRETTNWRPGHCISIPETQRRSETTEHVSDLQRLPLRL